MRARVLVALSAEERQVLLQAARGAIASHLERTAFAPPAVRGALSEPHGAFVTLRRRADGELRGCVGVMQAEAPLLATVARMAVAAAAEDGRFEPVTLGELAELAIDVSVLTPAVPIRPEEVEVGRHGLLISQGRSRGVLLPQVPLEQGWDRDTFLAHLCLKARLEPDAWRKPETELRAFEAVVFGE